MRPSFPTSSLPLQLRLPSNPTSSTTPYTPEELLYYHRARRQALSFNIMAHEVGLNLDIQGRSLYSFDCEDRPFFLCTVHLYASLQGTPLNRELFYGQIASQQCQVYCGKILFTMTQDGAQLEYVSFLPASLLTLEPTAAALARQTRLPDRLQRLARRLSTVEAQLYVGTDHRH